jgi:glycosyltransferase involved in cell wall biosynthesis
MNTPVRSVVVYTPYAWEHVLVSLRILRPLQEAGVQLVRGNEHMDIHPEYVSEVDAVILQREFPENLEVYEQILARARAEHKPVIYEIDDLLFELPEDHIDTATHYYSPALFAMLRAVIEADLVTTSTAPLQDYLRAFNPQVELLPNYLDDRLWTLRAETRVKNHNADHVVIGYMGTNTHQADIATIAPLLGRLLERYGVRLKLRFWGTVPPEALRSHPQVECQPIEMHSYAEFAAYFSQQYCDLFVAPLVDSPFNRCKSAIKFLEYSALGIPGVYSRTTPYQALVREGYNGCLAGTEQEWENRLNELIQSVELRSRIGKQALQTVQNEWLLSQHANQWLSAYQHAAGFAHDEQTRQNRAGYQDVFVAIANQVRGWQNKMYGQLIERDRKIQSLQEAIAGLQKQSEAQESYIQQIGKSRGWKILEAARRFKSRIFR